MMENLDAENRAEDSLSPSLSIPPPPPSTSSSTSTTNDDITSPRISALPGRGISSSEPRLSAFTSLTPSGGSSGGSGAPVKREHLGAKDLLGSPLPPTSRANPTSGFQVYSKMLDSAAAVTNSFRYADLSGLPLGYGRPAGIPPFGSPSSICK